MFLSSPDGGMEDLTMIDFDEEIKKFQPSQEVDEAEDAIYGNNTVDVTDIIDKIISKTVESLSLIHI